MYEHGPRAGNRGDVWKHFLLLTLLDLLMETRQPDTSPFLYAETHCGPALHVLEEGGSWTEGLGRVLPPPDPLARHPYFRLLGSRAAPGALYPGSWLQVALHLQRVGLDFRMSLLDNSERVANGILGLGISGDPGAKIRFQMGDGFRALACTSRWDLVLVDPPFWPNPQEDLARCREALPILEASGSVFLIWYPLYSPQESALGFRGPCHFLEILWGNKKGGASMAGCGVLVGGVKGSVLGPKAPWLHLLASCMGGVLRWRAAIG